jgi:hypothetical protein
MALLGHARGASRCYIGFENLTSLSSAAAPRRHGTGASGGATSLYAGTDAREDDSWAQAPVPETGLLVLAGAKKRTTVGDDAFFTRRFAFSAYRNWRARHMTCGHGPPCQRLDHWLRRSRGGALPRGGSTLLVRQFAFLTIGRGEDEGAHYHGAVARSLCGGSPSSHSKTIAPAV